MSINNISGDLDQNGVVGQNDQDLFTDILELDEDGTIELSDGIDADEATQLNEELSLRHRASDWNNLLNARTTITTDPDTDITTSNKTISSRSLNTLERTINDGVNQEVLSDLFEALGVANLDFTADLDPDNISFEDLGEGVMTEECFYAVFDSNGDGSLTLDELTSASEMLTSVANSGVMGTTDLSAVFAEYASTDVFFTVDLDDYRAAKDIMEAFVNEVRASSSWDFISNLIAEGIDVGIDPDDDDIQEIDLSKVVAFMNTVTDLADSGVMGANTSVETAYDEYLNEGFTVDAGDLASNLPDLQTYLNSDERVSDERVSTVWELLVELNDAGQDIGLSATNEVVNLSAVSALTTDYLAATIEGGAAGLISRINGSQAAENIMYYEFVEASEDRISFTDQELIVIDYLKDYATFKPLATNKQWITVSNLDSVIESFEPDPLF